MKYIFGYTGFSRMLGELLEQENEKEFGGYIVDEKYFPTEIKEDDRVVSWEKFREDEAPADTQIYVTIGYGKMNRHRKETFEKVKKYGYSVGTYINRHVIVSPSAEIGEGCLLFENCIIGPEVRLGKGNILFYGVHICHNAAVGDFNWMSCKTTVLGGSKIKDGCFFGANSVIRDNVTVEEETLVGACAFVNRSTEKKSVIVPERSIVLSKKSDEIVI